MTQALPSTVTDFSTNLLQVQERIANACDRVGVPAQSVRLLPVSKTVEEPRLRSAIAAGMTHLAENKAQEVKRKAENLADTGVTWAVIGHLQTNKAKEVARYATEFQALDSERVAAALNRRLELENRTLDVFVQVNTSGETSKSGLHPDQVSQFLDALPEFNRLRMRGFMTLALHSPDEKLVRDCFARLRGVRDAAQLSHPELCKTSELSMGMSGDYELAIAEGANCVRIGTALFGARNY